MSSNESSSLSTSALTKEQPNWHHFSQNYLKNDLDESENKMLPIKKVKNFNKNPERDLFESEMSEEELIEQSDQSEYKMIKIPETKNVIKNFSKSLFRFIQKQRVYVSRVLDHLNIKEEEFQKVFQQFRGKIYTIRELKLLWLKEGNIFDTAFRIISL